MKYKVKLTKQKSTHNNLRTDEVSGFTFDLPTIGESFRMFADPLETQDPDAVRIILTSPVRKIPVEVGENMLFETANSTYILEVEETTDDN